MENISERVMYIEGHIKEKVHFWAHTPPHRSFDNYSLTTQRRSSQKSHSYLSIHFYNTSLSLSFRLSFLSIYISFILYIFLSLLLYLPKSLLSIPPRSLFYKSFSLNFNISLFSLILCYTFESILSYLVVSKFASTYVNSKSVLRLKHVVIWPAPKQFKKLSKYNP